MKYPNYYILKKGQSYGKDNRSNHFLKEAYCAMCVHFVLSQLLLHAPSQSSTIPMSMKDAKTI